MIDQSLIYHFEAARGRVVAGEIPVAGVLRA